MGNYSGCGIVDFGRRLPSVMRSIGGSMREFKKGVNEGLSEDDDSPAENKNQENENSAPGAVSREKTSATESDDSKNEDNEKNEDQKRSL